MRREEAGTRTMAYYFVDDFGIEEVSNVLMSEQQRDRGQRGVEPAPGVFAPSAFSPSDDRRRLGGSMLNTNGPTFNCESLGNRSGQGQGLESGWDGTLASGEVAEAGTYAWRMVLDGALEGKACGKVG